MAQTHAKLIGGPMVGRSIEIPLNAKFGDIIPITMTRNSINNYTIEQIHHYRLAPNAAEGVIAAWVNPAERRPHGR